MVLSSGSEQSPLLPAGEPPLWRSVAGCLRISSVEGRSLGRSRSMELTSSDSSEEQLVGIGLKTPALTFLYRLCRSAALKGGSSAAISQITQPSDHISLFMSQGRSCQTSGLAQQGVPVCVQARPFLRTLETLRSPSLQVPSALMKMLAALRSRCRIFLSCSDLSPRVMSTSAFHMSPSLILVRAFRCWLMMRIRSPPAANSITMQRQPEGLSQKASLNLMMQSSVSEARMRISFRAFSFSFSFIPVIRTFFSAQISLSTRRRTWQTCPNAPSPTFFSTQNCFRVPQSLYIVLSYINNGTISGAAEQGKGPLQGGEREAEAEVRAVRDAGVAADDGGRGDRGAGHRERELDLRGVRRTRGPGGVEVRRAHLPHAAAQLQAVQGGEVRGGAQRDLPPHRRDHREQGGRGGAQGHPQEVRRGQLQRQHHLAGHRLHRLRPPRHAHALLHGQRRRLARRPVPQGPRRPALLRPQARERGRAEAHHRGGGRDRQRARERGIEPLAQLRGLQLQEAEVEALRPAADHLPSGHHRDRKAARRGRVHHHGLRRHLGTLRQRQPADDHPHRQRTQDRQRAPPHPRQPPRLHPRQGDQRGGRLRQHDLHSH